MTDTNPPVPGDEPTPPPVAPPPAAAPPTYPQAPAVPPVGPPPAYPPAAAPPVAGAPGYGQAPPYGQPPAAPGYGQAPPYGQPPAGAAYGNVPGPTDRLGRPLAEWWQRLVAIFIDGLILFVPKAIVGAVVITSTINNNGNGLYSAHLGLAAVILGIVFAVIDLAYFGYLNGSEKGQTVGQMALGIAVRDEASGGAIGTQRAAIRILVLEPAIIVGWLPVIGLIADLYTIVAGLSPLWDNRRQGFHDKVAKTDVIKVR